MSDLLRPRPVSGAATCCATAMGPAIALALMAGRGRKFWSSRTDGFGSTVMVPGAADTRWF